MSLKGATAHQRLRQVMLMRTPQSPSVFSPHLSRRRNSLRWVTTASRRAAEISSSVSSPGHRPMTALTPERGLCGWRRLTLSITRNSGAGGPSRPQHLRPPPRSHPLQCGGARRTGETPRFRRPRRSARRSQPDVLSRHRRVRESLKSVLVDVRRFGPAHLPNRLGVEAGQITKESRVDALVEQDSHRVPASTRAFVSSRNASTCSRVTEGKPSRKSSMDSPPSR